MEAVAPRLVKAEEFSRMPDPTDGTTLELVRGVVVAIPLTTAMQGIVCGLVGYAIRSYLDRCDLGFLACNDPGVLTERNPDTVRGPDLAFWSYGRMPVWPDHYPTAAPDIAVEVLPARSRRIDIRDKIREYFSCGSRQVWAFDPRDETLVIYSELDRGTFFEADVEVECDDILPGFRCRVSDFFPKPRPQAPAA